MNKKRIIVIILFLICIIVFFCCNTSGPMLKIKGRMNAIRYIEKKYDFRPRVKKVYCDKKNGDPLFLDFYNTGNVWACMTYKNQDFKVFISGEKITTEGCDNYQETLIKQAIIDKVDDYVTNIHKIETRFGNVYSTDELGYVSKFFDGTNLDEVLNSCDLSYLEVTTLNSNLDKVTKESIQNIFGSNLGFLFFDYIQETPIDNTKYINRNLLSESNLLDFISDNELYINEVKAYPVFNQHESTKLFSVDFTEGKYEELVYRYENGTYCNFHKIETQYFNEWMEDSDYSNDIPKIVYDIYSIDTDASKVIVFVPYKNFNVTRPIILKPRFYYETISDGNKNRRGNSNVLEEQGYIVTSIATEDTKNIMFTVVKVDDTQIVN